MAVTYGVGRLFMQPLDLDPGAPRLSAARTYETTHPYRHGRSLVTRLWGSRGLAAGFWSPNPGDVEDEATVTRHLLEALRSAEGTPEFLAASQEAWEAAGGHLRNRHDPVWLRGGDGDYQPPTLAEAGDRNDVPPDSGCPARVPARPPGPLSPVAV
jgi:hypothetical protein